MTHHQKLCSVMIFSAINLSNFMSAQKLSTPATRPSKTEVAPSNNNITLTNERTINTRQLEFSPAFFEDGIVFISSQKPASKEKVFDEHIESGTMSIFLARRDENGQLGKPQAFANSLVSSLHEGPLSFDKTAENIYFSRNNNENNGKKAKYTEGVSRLKIYTAQRQGESNWGVPTDLPFNENNSDACHPSISIDGDKLYFSSNRKGGYGGMDLYVCEKTNSGAWGKPRNLGPKINSAKNEVFPFIHADGTLFYSSDGLKGMGGLDIFYALWEVADYSNSSANAPRKSGFNTPINLGESVNSNRDDFGFIVDLDLRNGYLTSNRKDGVGGDDIYAFTVNEGTLFENLKEEKTPISEPVVAETSEPIKPNPTPKVEVKKVKPNIKTNARAKTNTPINSTVQSNPIKNEEKPIKTVGEFTNLIVIDRQTGKPIANAVAAYLNLNDVSLSDIVATNNGSKNAPFVNPDGTYNLEFVASKMTNKPTNTVGKAQFKTDKNGNYVVNVTKEGYETEQLTIKKGDVRDDIVVLLSRPTQHIAIKEGVSFKLNNVYYNYNDAAIRPDAARDLDALFALMTKYPDMEVELSSHTDARGTPDYNLTLSQRRAESAVQYLVRKGIDSQRITAIGYGESQLKNHCASGVFCSENEHKINRRTEVKIIKSGSAEGQMFGN
jgi:outer membrane protein OmpA-like peptidoglycan-associated protein